MTTGFRGVGVKLMRTQQLLGGDPAGVLEVAKLCDRMGVDEVHVSDHVLVTGSGHRGRPGFPYPVDYPGWFEPISMLSASMSEVISSPICWMLASSRMLRSTNSTWTTPSCFRTLSRASACAMAV